MKTISITSGKGGVGKSITTVNLAIELARRKKRVLVFDADMGLANIDILCDLHCEHSLIDFVEGRKELGEIRVQGPGGITVLPASSGILKLERLTEAQQINIANALGEMSSDFDLLLVDTGAGLSDNVLFFNACVEDVLVVVTPDPTSITDAYALIKILATRHGVTSLTLLVNQASNAALGRSTYDKLAGVCQRFLGFAPRYGGHLVQDTTLEEAVRARRPVVITNPTAPISRCFSELAGRFDALFPVQPSGKAFWRRLMERRQGGA